MTRDETLALWARCETQRRLAREDGADEDTAHAAAKKEWDAWVQPLLARRAQMEQAGTWQVEKDVFGSIEPGNPDTVAWFVEATADFSGHVFEDAADFRGFVFPGPARFLAASPTPDTSSRPTTFKQNARFDGATFSGDARFGGATFAGAAWFERATFAGDARFGGATFSGAARFGGATFSGSTQFDHARFRSTASFRAIRAERAFSLVETTFEELPDFIQAHFEEAPDLDATRVHAAQARRGDFSKVLAQRKLNPVKSNVSSQFRALKRIAIQAHDQDQEHDFAAGELRGRRGVQDHAWPSLRRALGRTDAGEVKDTKTGETEQVERRSWYFLDPPKGFTRQPREPVFQGMFRFWVGALYGLFSDYGRSVWRPVGWWIVLTSLFAAAYLSAHISDHDRQVTKARATVAAATRAIAAACADPADAACTAARADHAVPIELEAVADHRFYCVTSWQRLIGAAIPCPDRAGGPRDGRAAPLPPPELKCMTQAGYRDPAADAVALAVRKGLLFLGLDQAETLNQINACLYGVDVTVTAGRLGGELVPVLPYSVGWLSLLQTLCSAVLLFLFLLAARNMFKIR